MNEQELFLITAQTLINIGIVMAVPCIAFLVEAIDARQLPHPFVELLASISITVYLAGVFSLFLATMN